MSFTKNDGNRLTATLLWTWGGSALAGWVVSVLSDLSALNAFIKMFAICISAIVFAHLVRRDLLSSLLLIGGGLIAFAITVFLFKLLGL